MLDAQTLSMLGQGILDTLYMVLLSTLFAHILGIPMGILLVVTDRSGILPCRPVNLVLGVLINVLRSVPFLILLILLIPFTRFLVGTSLGPTATIVSLVVSAAPFIARLVESALKEVDSGVIEAAQSMGASTMEIICKVMVPEARPSLLVNGAIAITTILGYSSMAGFVGGGGLGDIAIRYGYYRYDAPIMLITVALLVLLVQVFQEAGMKIARTIDKRIR